MRLDKFLKVSRIIKRRTVANDAAKGDKVLVNGKPAKPSLILKIGDIVSVNYFKKLVEVKVLSLTPSIRKDDASNMYEIIRIEDKEAVE
jgi:ribosomal 50S subunit-recycling heat shock protein